MTTYMESVLGKNEEVLYQAKVSLIPFWPWYLLSGFFILSAALSAVGGLANRADGNAGASFGTALLMIVFAGLLLIRPLIAYFTTELVITNRRIVSKRGLIARHTLELNLSKIESIGVNQSILGRLCNYGTVLVIGTGGSKEPIKMISSPIMFRKKYDEVVEKLLEAESGRKAAA